jgi:hypothetical protein
MNRGHVDSSLRNKEGLLMKARPLSLMLIEQFKLVRISRENSAELK